MGPDVIRDLERRENSGLTLRAAEALAKALECSPVWLAFGHDEDGTISVPLVSWVAAGDFGQADVAEPIHECPRIKVAGLHEGRWIALRVEGDSMDRISPPGSVILVDTTDKSLIANACYVIANEHGEATYKRYRPAPDRFEPVSTNKELDAIFPKGAVAVVGRVRRSILEM